MSGEGSGAGGTGMVAYRALLLLYPPSFRRRFAQRMADDAAELLRSERARGRPALAVLLRVWIDVFRSAPREWWRLIANDGGRASGSGRHEARRPGDPILQDMHAAVRRLSRTPGFSIGLVLLLGVGIGAATAVSSVISAYLVRPLPYPEADRLYVVQPVVPVLPREARDLFEIPVTWDLDAFTLVGDEGSEHVLGSWVTPEYFEAFGMRAALGRLFAPDETGPGGSSVAVIGHELWQRRWGGDPDVVGRTVRAFTSDRPDDAEVFTVVGVLPPDMWHYNRYTEFLAPLRAENPVYLARVRAGIPPEEIARALEERGRARMGFVPEGFRVRLVPLQTGYTAPLRPVLFVGALAVGLVLLIAWANGAVLLLLRAQTREREFWIRRALGAGRLRLARQLGIEALLLSAGAAAIGVLLASLALGLSAESLQMNLGRPVPGGAEALRVDAYALVATAAATGLTALVFALVPWLGALGAGLSHGLAEAGRGNTGGRVRNRLRNLLVTAEIALSLTLLVAGALAVRSARHLATLDLGFQPDNVYTANVLLRARSYPEAADRAEFYDRLALAARELPGVESAAVSEMAPFRWGYTPQPAEGEGPDGTASAGRVDATRRVVGPGWFATMAIPLVRGRTFRVDDGVGADPLAIVSERLALRLWPGQDPVGRRLRFPPRQGADAGAQPGPWHTVIGVVSDIRDSLEGEGSPAVYLPIAQVGATTVTVVTRLQAESPSPLPALSAMLKGLDPSLALYATGWLTEPIEGAGRPSRFLAGFLGGFSAFAVVLAMVGLYAVLAFAAAQRKRDVAIRMALGARRGVVVRQFLAQGMGLVGMGVLLGTAGAALLARRISGQLHGVDPMGPATYAAGALLLVVVAALATWFPARRAALGDPVAVLREE